MKETFYFSHDYNARSDEKIKKLLVKHGVLGYGVYWAIIEDLYQNANAMRTDYECIAYELRVDESCIKSIINDFDLFEIDNDVFGSLSVQRRLDERDKKSKKARESALYRWSKKNENANAMRTQCDSNAIKESKGKEKKVKESKGKDLKSLFEEFRILYKGTKKGLDTEYNNLLKKHKDYKEIIPLLKNAVLKEIEHKESLISKSLFCPEWKNLTTWINNRCWEQEFQESTRREYALESIRKWFENSNFGERLTIQKLGVFLTNTKHIKYLKVDISKNDFLKKTDLINNHFGKSDGMYEQMMRFDDEYESSFKGIVEKAYKTFGL